MRACISLNVHDACIMRVIYKHVKSEAAPSGPSPAHRVLLHMLLWLPGTRATVSQEPPLNGLSHPDNQQLSAVRPVLP